MNYSVRKVTIEDYDAIYELWNSTEQSRRALNPVDDSREGIDLFFSLMSVLLVLYFNSNLTRF